MIGIESSGNCSPAPPPKPALQVAEKKPESPGAAQGPAEMPKPAGDANQHSTDGFLVNGSVNNAATSQYSLNQAFGNRRFNTTNLYNGGFRLILDNSALDARQYSLSGFSTPKPVYDRITAGFAIGGPLKIPHLLPRGPNFFVGYQWTRNHTAQTDPHSFPHSTNAPASSTAQPFRSVRRPRVAASLSAAQHHRQSLV